MVPNDFSLVSFDVESLFTNVPLDFTIDVILDRIYVKKDIQTNIEQRDFKRLLVLCPKNVHFCFNGSTYTQSDGVAMGSPY